MNWWYSTKKQIIRRIIYTGLSAHQRIKLHLTYKMSSDYYEEEDDDDNGKMIQV